MVHGTVFVPTPHPKGVEDRLRLIECALCYATLHWAGTVARAFSCWETTGAEPRACDPGVRPIWLEPPGVALVGITCGISCGIVACTAAASPVLAGFAAGDFKAELALVDSRGDSDGFDSSTSLCARSRTVNCLHGIGTHPPSSWLACGRARLARAIQGCLRRSSTPTRLCQSTSSINRRASRADSSTLLGSVYLPSAMALNNATNVSP
jgi:hypothetical protein